MIQKAEQGAALLTVLLLVAVMATVAATALDRITLAARMHGNAAIAGQARHWLGTAELIALSRIEDLQAADSAQTLPVGWLGAARKVELPGGGSVTARLHDAGNCFNLNSLVLTDLARQRIVRPEAHRQFVALMVMNGVAEGQASAIASATSDWIDSDSVPLSNGAEEAEGRVAGNTPMVDESELRAVPGVSGELYQRLRRWICALPETELSRLNVNTLQPDQAMLLAMLDPVAIGLSRARAQLAQRPAAGYGSAMRFWQSPILAGVSVAPGIAEQAQVRTRWFRLEAATDLGGLRHGSETLIDAAQPPARIVRRRWMLPQ